MSYTITNEQMDDLKELVLRWNTRGLGNPLPGEENTDADIMNRLSESLGESGMDLLTDDD
jgi:hypothetical protein